MTREEAIEKLELMRQKVDEETYRALILAIKALEQNESAEEWYKLFVEKLEQEPCEDAISRDAVLEWCGDINMDVYTNEVKEFVNQLPSVTQKSGKWIDDGFYAEGYSHKAFHCSKCGHNVLGFKEDLSNYCPDCGAKMESNEMDCRDCKEWESCPCGKDGHEKGTSQGYSIGECKDFEPQESEDKK